MLHAVGKRTGPYRLLRDRLWLIATHGLSTGLLLSTLAACGSVSVQSTGAGTPGNVQSPSGNTPTASSTSAQQCSSDLHCAP
jgi:hypothetical protein